MVTCEARVGDLKGEIEFLRGVRREGAGAVTYPLQLHFGHLSAYETV
jgi:hypothetical protein